MALSRNRPAVRPALSQTLLDRLGLSSASSQTSKKRTSAGRKNGTKATRVQKRQLPRNRTNEQSQGIGYVTQKNLVSTRQTLHSADSDDSDHPADTPRTPNPKSRSSVLQKDDDDIARLERKLGLTGEKSLSSTQQEDDGMAGLLQGIDHNTDDSQLNRGLARADEHWLLDKRKKAQLKIQTANDSSADTDDRSDSDMGNTLDSGDNDEEEDGEERGKSDSSCKTLHGPLPPKRIRENPFKAPTDPNQKYIPPPQRPAISVIEDDAQLLLRLQRQLQGLLNRLSEANLVAIVKDVRHIFVSNPRQYAMSTLVHLLMTRLCDRAALSDAFLILHAVFIAAMNKVLGAHFAAHVLERFVADFSTYYAQEVHSLAGSKQNSNLISLLANLYSFQLVNSNIVYDYVKMFCLDLTDLNAELLLRLIRTCGPQLRADNPSALKDVVMLVQQVLAQKSESTLSVRTKFMVEMIVDLKNNKVKNLTSQMVTESIFRAKKLLNNVSSPHPKGSETMTIGLGDITNVDKAGKWWLVGANWKEASAANADSTDRQTQSLVSSNEEGIFSGVLPGDQLLDLAKLHRMNTDIRRAVFTTILSAADYKDCNLRLRRLGLNKKQQLEIPRVLVYCAGMEDTYNPYYQLVADQTCTEHRFRKAFEFCLWNMFRRLGEKGAANDESDDEDTPEDSVNVVELVNIGKMYGGMIASLSMPITILKVLNLMRLGDKTRTLIEILFVSLFQTTSKQAKAQDDHEKLILSIFSRAKEEPHLLTGLRFFLPTVVKQSALVNTDKQKKALKRNCRLAMDVLALIHSSTAS